MVKGIKVDLTYNCLSSVLQVTWVCVTEHDVHQLFTLLCTLNIQDKVNNQRANWSSDFFAILQMNVKTA